MSNTELSPQGYNITEPPVNNNPFWGSGQTENGLPVGGNTGDILVKKSPVNFDAQWQPSTGVTQASLDSQLTPIKQSVITETTDRTNADNIFTAGIAATNAALLAEETARKSADIQLQTNIDNVPVYNDSILSARVTANAGAISTETTNRIAADKIITENATALSLSVTSLTGRISENETDILKLQKDLAAETANRSDSDNVLRGEISTEVTARKNEDFSLSSRIVTVDGRVDTVSAQVPPSGASDNGKVYTAKTGQIKGYWETPNYVPTVPAVAGGVLMSNDQAGMFWNTLPKFVPTPFEENQVLTSTAQNGFAWATPQTGGLTATTLLEHNAYTPLDGAKLLAFTETLTIANTAVYAAIKTYQFFSIQVSYGRSTLLFSPVANRFNQTPTELSLPPLIDGRWATPHAIVYTDVKLDESGVVLTFGNTMIPPNTQQPIDFFGILITGYK